MFEPLVSDMWRMPRADGFPASAEIDHQGFLRLQRFVLEP